MSTERPIVDRHQWADETFEYFADTSNGCMARRAGSEGPWTSVGADSAVRELLRVVAERDAGRQADGEGLAVRAEYRRELAEKDRVIATLEQVRRESCLQVIDEREGMEARVDAIADRLGVEAEWTSGTDRAHEALETIEVWDAARETLRALVAKQHEALAGAHGWLKLMYPDALTVWLSDTEHWDKAEVESLLASGAAQKAAEEWRELREAAVSVSRLHQTLRARAEAAETEIAEAMRLLSPACPEETLAGAIRNLQQAHVTERTYAETAEREIARLRALCNELTDPETEAEIARLRAYPERVRREAEKLIAETETHQAASALCELLRRLEAKEESE